MDKKDDTLKTILNRARRYCAGSEQCESAVRQKATSWGADEAQADAVVQALRSEGYLDDQRYAEAYCRSKLLGQRWSRQKVRYLLRLKQLPDEVVAQAMAQIDDATYYGIATAEAGKKLRQLGGELTAESRHKVMAFLAQRGYTAEECHRAMNALGQIDKA